MIRIGVIGAGVISEFGHVPALRRSAEFELVAVYDPILERAEALAAAYADGKSPATAFADAEAFYNTPMDAVIVASPLPTHYEVVLQAAAQGLHVLCEKPIAETDEQAEEMSRAMTGKVFGIGLVYRHSIVTGTLGEWIRDGSLGEVKMARFSYLWGLHGQFEKIDGAWRESPRWRGRMLEGGPMIDCGVHFIDLASLFFGDVEMSSGFGAWLADYEAPDYILGTLVHSTGARSVVEVGFTYGHTAADPASLFTYDLLGTGGSARYDRNGWHLERRNGERTTIATGGSEKEFDGMYATFASAIKGGSRGVLATAEDAKLASYWARSITDQAISTRENRVKIPNL